jgi:hypothetical protein
MDGIKQHLREGTGPGGRNEAAALAAIYGSDSTAAATAASAKSLIDAVCTVTCIPNASLTSCAKAATATAYYKCTKKVSHKTDDSKLLMAPEKAMSRYIH